MRKIDTAVNLFGFVLIAALLAINSCITVNNELPKQEVVTVQVDTMVYVNKIAKLNKQIKKLKKEKRFIKYQRDSLQCKIDSFIYSIIKKEEAWQK